MQLTPRIDPVRPVNTSFKMRKRESAWLLLQTGVEGMFAKSGRIAKPVYQCSQSRTIFLSYGCEFQCQSTTRLRTLHNCVGPDRSEEHTSELQSRLHLVCRLLLEKKKKQRHNCSHYTTRALS